MKIRLAQLDDTDSISRIVSVLDTENYFFSHFDKIQRSIEKKNYYVVEDKNEKIIGAMILNTVQQSCQLYLIASEKKGSGKNLIDFAVQKCKEENISKLWCWSLVRYNAKGFYKKMGFEELYLLKNQWFNEDCYFFGKIIE